MSMACCSEISFAQYLCIGEKENLRWIGTYEDLRGSNSKKKIFVCFNAMQFIFGHVLGHGTTNIKISFSKLPLPWLPC